MRAEYTPLVYKYKYTYTYVRAEPSGAARARFRVNKMSVLRYATRLAESRAGELIERKSLPNGFSSYCVLPFYANIHLFALLYLHFLNF